MKKLILVLLIIIHYSCNAQLKEQESNCYRGLAGSIENKLPNDICIKKDETIYALFNTFDFNSDGLLDVAISKGNKKRKDGYQIYLVIYEKINDSTYTEFRKLDNMYPLWFANYSSSIDDLKDPKLKAIREQYSDVKESSFEKIELIENKIILTLNADVGYRYILTFIFSKEKQDWFLSSYLEHDFFEDTKTPYHNEKLNTSISDFSYLGFFNGEY